jgi:hypothetical protein
VLALASPARAQDDAQRAEARTEFEAGMTAARAGEWPTAHDHFARAFEIAPIPGVLMNLAGAQRQTGRLVASAASYRRWLAEVTSGRDARHRPTVEQALAEVEGAIPQLTIVATGLADGDHVQVDGATRVSIAEPIPLDPGAHYVAITRAGRTLVEEQVDLEEGERETIEIAAPVVPGPRQVAEHEAEREREAAEADARTTTQGGDDPTGFIVLGVGLGLAAVAAVVIGVVVATSSPPAAYQGNFGPGTVAIP